MKGFGLWGREAVWWEEHGGAERLEVLL